MSSFWEHSGIILGLFYGSFWVIQISTPPPDCDRKPILEQQYYQISPAGLDLDYLLLLGLGEPGFFKGSRPVVQWRVIS